MSTQPRKIPEIFRFVQLLFTLLSMTFCIACSRTPELALNNPPKVSQETLADDIDDGRKLSDYDYGGKQSCENTVGATDSDGFGGAIAVRDFIYQHWTKRRRGLFSYRCSGIDASNTSYYFVEPKVGDKWIIVEKALYTNISTKTRSLETFEFEDVKKFDSVGDKTDSYIELIKNNGEVKSIPFQRKSPPSRKMK